MPFSGITRETLREAHSDGGMVTVRIDSTGRIREITLDPELSGVSAESLAEATATIDIDDIDDQGDEGGPILGSIRPG
jgi:hypothetical protein